MKEKDKRLQRRADCDVILFCLGLLGILLLFVVTPRFVADDRTVQTVELLGIAAISTLVCGAYLLRHAFGRGSAR